MKTRILLPALAAAVLILSFGSVHAADAPASTPVAVVELFTSQGCSSCPPADDFVAELSGRDDVIALSHHVDYWNYIGWRDPFSSAAATRRQRDYVRAMGRRYPYTPQVVVDGAAEVTGSNRRKIVSLITAAKARQKLQLTIKTDAEGKMWVYIPAGEAGTRPATIWAAIYDRRHVTNVTRGENTGRKLTNTNVVRAMTALGTWSGKAMKIAVPLSGKDWSARDGCAVLVQAGRGGAILGAAKMALR